MQTLERTSNNKNTSNLATAFFDFSLSCIGVKDFSTNSICYFPVFDLPSVREMEKIRSLCFEAFFYFVPAELN